MKKYLSPQTTSVDIELMSVLMVSNNAGLQYDNTSGIDPTDAI